MLGAVIVDHPAAEGLDLGKSITLINGITVLTSSDLATRLVRGLLVLTEPGNWQNFAAGNTRISTTPVFQCALPVAQLLILPLY